MKKDLVTLTGGKRQEMPALATRLHQRCRTDFRRSRRLGAEDHVVTWEKPQRPGWMDEAAYAALPAALAVRAVRVRLSSLHPSSFILFFPPPIAPLSDRL